MLAAMINALHALIYAEDAAKARAFFRDVLKFPTIDAGEGWLLFAMPPAELGVHPAEHGTSHQLYFMCDDINKTIAELEAKGVKCAEVRNVGWGMLTSFDIPGGGNVGLYQPRHKTAFNVER